MARLRMVLALVAVAALCASFAGPASAEVLRHQATGFAASAPADFRVTFHRPTGNYVIFSRRRQVAVRYQRVRTGRSPRVVGQLLARTSRAAVAARHGGDRGVRMAFASGVVVRVRRAGRAAISVTRFDQRSWSGKRRLLARIARSIKGGRAVRLRRAREKPAKDRSRTRQRRTDRERPDRRPAPAPAPPAGAPAAPPAEPGNVLFRSDFESGTFAGWYLQSLRERATITNGAFGSSHAARFEVRDRDVEPDTGDERSELSLSNPKLDEGQDVYIRDSIRVPSESSIGSSWQIIQQLHEVDWDSSPGVAVFVRPGPAIKIGSGDSDLTFLPTTPIQADRWHDLIYRVKLSRDPSVGFMEVWLDGAPQRLANGETRIYGRTIQTHRTYLKAGIYRGRDHTGTSIVEHDNIVIGTTFAAVAGS